MEAFKRIALLLVGLGAGEILAAEAAGGGEEETSPIFVVRVAAVPVTSPTKGAVVLTPVESQLALLIRSDAEAIKGLMSPDPEESSPADLAGMTLQLEKMTVKGRRLLEPPVLESTLEKFTRTGHLWEFSPTKRLMLGPHGDKVGLMFSFDF